MSVCCVWGFSFTDLFCYELYVTCRSNSLWILLYRESQSFRDKEIFFLNTKVTTMIYMIEVQKFIKIPYGSCYIKKTKASKANIFPTRGHTDDGSIKVHRMLINHWFRQAWMNIINFYPAFLEGGYRTCKSSNKIEKNWKNFWKSLMMEA